MSEQTSEYIYPIIIAFIGCMSIKPFLFACCSIYILLGGQR